MTELHATHPDPVLRRASLGPSAPRREHDALVERLNAHSVHKRHDAYADVDWDAPEHRVDAADPRFELPADEGLGATAWYRALPPERRARLGLAFVASQLRVGIEFENVLQRGLLTLAATRPLASPEVRYAYHEVIEEAHHSLMFRELVLRAFPDETVPVGLDLLERAHARLVPGMARSFPELFFLFVLGGEVPIDHVQRRALARRGDRLHPLLRRVLRIHVTEEARHVSFAESFLAERVPRLDPWRLRWLRLRTPLILADMAKVMMVPRPPLVRAFGVPRAVLREAYAASPEHRADVVAAIARVRELCTRVGIVTPIWSLLWRALGLWPAGPDYTGPAASLAWT